MRQTLFKNLRLQTYLQILNTIIPLITTPYVARVLGASMIGVYSSFHATASFFTLFAVLGTNNYGTRSISSEVDNEKRKKVFWEVYCLQLITSLFAILSYLVYCIFYASNKMMAYLQLITLVGCFLEVSWFYFGIEDFSVTVNSSMVFRILSVFLLFLFVKGENDLWVYSVIMLGSAFMSQLTLWVIMIRKGYCKPSKIKIKDVFKHFKPNIELFIPILAMTINTSTDKVMLGMLSTFEQAGFYSNIDRIINVPCSIFTGIGTVFMSRISALNTADGKKAKEFFFVSLSGIEMLSIAICCGLFAVSGSFIPFFLGPGYESCIGLVRIFSPIIIIRGLSNAIRMHYLVPFRKENIYIKSTIIGAVINIVLNYILVAKYGALGAIITTILSEAIVLLIQVVCVFNFCEMKRTLTDLFWGLCFGVLMIGVIHDISFENAFLLFVFDVIIGVIIFSSLTIVYWKISNNKMYQLFINPLFMHLLKKKNSND